MQHGETESKLSEASIDASSRKHGAHFMAVRDSRNRRVSGIYTRNGRYYAQLWVTKEDGTKTARKFPLVTEDGTPVGSLAAAKEAAEILRNDRRTNKLPTSGHKPKFADYVKAYYEKPGFKRKKEGTRNLEKWALDRWAAHFGSLQIHRIEARSIITHREDRLRTGIDNRTANLDLIALRNVLKAAVDDGYLREIPKVKGLKTKPSPKRPLMNDDQFQSLLASVPEACEKNAAQFTDYLKFLGYTGGREKESLKVRWNDVNFDRKKVTIGAGGVAKNSDQRDVDFNPQLEALLLDMHKRRAPDCSWVFPSPQRGKRDDHAKTFRESLLLARTKAGLEWIGFHDLRHRFASVAVMAGIDFMTIAEWLGHKDRGMLVAKVYGHLSDTHKATAAAKLKF